MQSTNHITKTLEAESSKTIIKQFNQLKSQRILFIEATTVHTIFSKVNYLQHATDCERTYVLHKLKEAAKENEKIALLDNLRARKVPEIDKVIQYPDDKAPTEALDFAVDIDVLEIHANLKWFLKSLNNQQGIGLLGIQATNAVFEHVAGILLGTSDNYSWTNRIEVVDKNKILIKEYVNIRYVSFKNILMEDGNMKIIPSKTQIQPILLNLTQYYVTAIDDEKVKAEVFSTETYFSTQITQPFRNRILFYLCYPYSEGLKKDLQDLTNNSWYFLTEYFEAIREQSKAPEVSYKVAKGLSIKTDRQPIYQPTLLCINPFSFEKKFFNVQKLTPELLNNSIKEIHLLNSIPKNAFQIVTDAASECLNVTINFTEIILKSKVFQILYNHQLNSLELEHHSSLLDKTLKILLENQKNTLQHLTIKNCQALRCPDFSALKNLKSLSVIDCREILELSLPNYASMQLDLSGCSQLNTKLLQTINVNYPDAKMPYQITTMKPKDKLFEILIKDNTQDPHDYNFRTLKYLLSQNIELLKSTWDDNTPLHLAAKNGHFKIVKFILPLMQAENLNIALPNKDKKTAAALAKENGHTDIANYIATAVVALNKSITGLNSENSAVTTIIKP